MESQLLVSGYPSMPFHVTAPFCVKRANILHLVRGMLTHDNHLQTTWRRQEHLPLRLGQSQAMYLPCPSPSPMFTTNITTRVPNLHPPSSADLHRRQSPTVPLGARVHHLQEHVHHRHRLW